MLKCFPVNYLKFIPNHTGSMETGVIKQQDDSVRQHSRAFWLYSVTQHPQPSINEHLSVLICLSPFPMLDEHTLNYAHLQRNKETTMWISAFSLRTYVSYPQIPCGPKVGWKWRSFARVKNVKINHTDLIAMFMDFISELTQMFKVTSTNLETMPHSITDFITHIRKCIWWNNPNDITDSVFQVFQWYGLSL